MSRNDSPMRIRRILEDSVRRHMQRDVVTLLQDMTVAEALAKLRTVGLNDKIAYVYVVDEDGKLVGVAGLRKLVSATATQRVAEIMIQQPIYLNHRTLVAAALDRLLETRYLALPVVNDDGILCGAIDVQTFTTEITEVAERCEIDHIFQLIGSHVALGRSSSLWISFADRFPWLLTNITSGLIAAVVVSRFEWLIREAAVLAMFLAVVLALAESIGMQAMAITIQGFGTRGLSFKFTLHSLKQEISAALLIGLGAALIIGGFVWVWKGEPTAALAIGGAVWLTVITAGAFGVLLPSLVKQLRADPKVAAGPIVLALADLAALLVYFNLAKFLLSS